MPNNKLLMCENSVANNYQNPNTSNSSYKFKGIEDGNQLKQKKKK